MEPISNLADLIHAVGKIADSWAPGPENDQRLWFRGQASGEHTLLPSLYRPNEKRWGYIESSLFEQFKVYGTPYIPNAAFLHPSSDWHWYFLARHHGLPSRLLDWTESLLVATYFAIEESVSDIARPEFETQRRQPLADCSAGPVVWVLDAGSINDAACSEDDVYIAGGPFTANYLPDAIENCAADCQNREPIALLPPRANARIVAQQGVFTLHGRNDAPLETIASESSKIKLASVPIANGARCLILRDLLAAGVSRASIYADLDSVARDIRWNAQRASRVTV
jgi:hypothetical protein